MFLGYPETAWCFSPSGSVGDFQPLMCGWCGVMELCIGPNLGLRMLILVTENDSKPIQRHCFPKKMENWKNIICLPCYKISANSVVSVPGIAATPSLSHRVCHVSFGN